MSKHQQIVVPKEVVPVILRQLHNNIGHPWPDHTTSLIIDRFYWPRMGSDIAALVEECDRF